MASVGGDPSLGIMAIFRNEAQLLFEWLLHYTAEGATQFVLLDHTSVDDGAEHVQAFQRQHPSVDISMHQVSLQVSSRAHLYRILPSWRDYRILFSFRFRCELRLSAHFENGARMSGVAGGRRAPAALALQSPHGRLTHRLGSCCRP